MVHFENILKQKLSHYITWYMCRKSKHIHIYKLKLMNFMMSVGYVPYVKKIM